MASKLSEQTVRDALQHVIDPELGMSIVDLNMVRQIEIRGGQVSISLVLTVPGCPLAAWIAQQVEQAVRVLEGVEGVEILLLDEPWEPPAIDTWQDWLARGSEPGSR
jgi:ATP-binding protein involved in chromosome partitioning